MRQDRATQKQIQKQAEYIVILAEKILEASKGIKDGGSTRASGTLMNLAPELSKAASKIKQMNTCAQRQFTSWCFIVVISYLPKFK